MQINQHKSLKYHSKTAYIYVNGDSFYDTIVKNCTKVNEPTDESNDQFRPIGLELA